MEFTHVFGVAGSALSVDTAPNSAPPADARLFYAPRFSGGVQGAGIEMFLAALGGTTCTIQVWSKNDQFSRWFSVVGATGAVPVDSILQGLKVKPGSQLFIQITANTGVERIGVGFTGQVENKNR